MAILRLLTVSEGIAVDQTTNQLSLFNLLEQLTVSGFPFMLPQVAVTAIWEPEAGDEVNEWQQITTIRSPNNAEQNFPTNFRFGQGQQHRIMQRLFGLPVTGVGALEFTVRLNGQVQGTCRINIALDTTLAAPGAGAQ